MNDTDNPVTLLAGFEGIKAEDLFTIEELQRLQDLFSTATGVASLITRPDGTPLTRESNFCRLCSTLIRHTETGRINCQHSDALLGRHNPDGPVVQHCLSAGLWDAGASITVNGIHIANWLIGQVRDPSMDEDQMTGYAQETGIDPEVYREALRQVPVMPVSQFRAIADMLFVFTNNLSEKAFHNLLLKKQIRESLEAGR